VDLLGAVGVQQLARDIQRDEAGTGLVFAALDGADVTVLVGVLEPTLVNSKPLLICSTTTVPLSPLLSAQPCELVQSGAFCSLLWTVTSTSRLPLTYFCAASGW
jgi:hypothetical protein